MSRDNYNYGYGSMENNHRKNQMVRDAARSVDIDPDDLSAELHSRKGDWFEGDFSYSDLVKIAKEIKAEKR